MLLKRLSKLPKELNAMLSDDRFGMLPLWEHLLGILDEVDKICKKHHLRYYVTDGNALGAVRHKGFIPWDDDLDISMPRPDYVKFMELAKEELPSYLKFVNWENRPEFFFLFGKVQDIRKDKVLEIEDKVGFPLSNGLFIDIFPIDGYPMTWVAKKILTFKYLFLRPIHRYLTSPLAIQSKKGSFLWRMGAVFSCILPFWKDRRSIMSLMERLVTKYPFESSELTGRTCSRMTILQRKPIARSVWGNGRRLEFHDREVIVPDDVYAHLENEFGDYMKMPPPERQKPSHSYSYSCPWIYG